MGSDDQSPLSTAALCGFYGLGVVLCLGVYGVLQERIMSIPYGGEMFTVSVFLVFCNRIIAIVYAAAMITYNGEGFKNQAPLWKYLAISFSSVGATTCQYEALKWVSFPVQMLGKSFKMMPVMLWGMAISGKTYKWIDWAVAAGVTWGVTQFLLTGSIASPHAGETNNSAHGLLLLMGFLALDGFTSTCQEKLFKEHTTSKYNQMLYVNLGSALTSIISLVLAGAIHPALAFCAAHPDFVRDAMTLSAAAVTGQWFIYSQVKEFGALVFAATMNVRQVISILVSYVKFGHPVTQMQVLGLLFVFGALFYKSLLGLIDARPKREKGSLEEKKSLLEAPEAKPYGSAKEP